MALAVASPALGASSKRIDRDRDGLSDRYERHRSHTSPVRADSDRDGLSDGREVRRYHTKPRRRDRLADASGVLVFHTSDAPNTSVKSGPFGSTSTTSASFWFSSTESGSTFECSLDGGSWSSCPPPKSDVAPVAAFSLSPGAPLTGEDVTFDASGSTCAVAPCQYQWVDVGGDGPGGTDWPLGSGQVLHFTFQYVGVKYVQLTVTDANGATDTVERDVTVAAAPVLDTTPPDTTITASPPASTSSTSASFSFTGTDGVGVSGYECQLDGGPWSDCSSPKGYSGLAVGSHSFRVRASDAAGNVDPTPASWTWTVAPLPGVDTTPPDTTITSGPSGTISTGDASLSFTSTESGSAFDCRIDAGAWAACSTPKSFTNLANGSHTFDVRATDGAGNVDASPASRTWTVNVGATGSCFSVPSACGFPDATNAGVPAGTTLTPSGSITISTPGAIVQNLDVNGRVVVAANNVTIKNTRVTATGGPGAWGVEVRSGISGTLVLDSTIRGAGLSNGQEVESAVRALGGSGLTIRGSDLYNCGHCIITYQSLTTVTDSYIRSNAIGGGYHFEGMYVCSKAITMDHNTIYNPNQQTATVFGDTICGGGNNFTVTNSLLAGGGFLVYPQANSSSLTGSMNIAGNRFARCLGTPVYNSGSGGTACSGLATRLDDGHGYYPYGGYFNVAAHYYSSGQIWSNNRWDDNGQTICPNRSAGCP